MFAEPMQLPNPRDFYSHTSRSFTPSLRSPRCYSALIHATLFATAALCQESDGVVKKVRELARSGRLQQAEQTLRQAIESQPGTPALHGELGSLLYSSKRFEEAIEYLGRAAQLDPKNSRYTIQLAGALIGAKRFSVAIDLLNAV